MLDAQAEGAARAARAGPRDDLPGADDAAQPADEDLRALRGGPARSTSRTCARRRPAQRALETLARHGHPADALRPVPARVLGRHAAADHDRAGARAAARGGRGRRADDRARRARRGADPAHHRRPAAQLRHGAAADHAQPRDRRRGLRSRRRHVRRPRSSSRARPTTSRPSRRTRTRASCCARRSRSRRPSCTRSRARRRTSSHPPPACRFHPRCPDAMQVCAEQWPPTITVGTGAPLGVLAARPTEDIPAGLEAPLEREALAVAEEA